MYSARKWRSLTSPPTPTPNTFYPFSVVGAHLLVDMTSPRQTDHRRFLWRFLFFFHFPLLSHTAIPSRGQHWSLKPTNQPEIVTRMTKKDEWLMLWWPPRTGTWDAAFQIERYHWLVEGEPSVYLLANSTATSHPGNTTVETRENFESTWAFNSFFVFKNVLPLIFLWLTLLPKEGESSSRIAILVFTTVFRITQIECSFVSSAFSDFSQTYRCYLCRRKCLLFVVIIRMLKAVKKKKNY